jgi:hypothetical protein
VQRVIASAGTLWKMTGGWRHAPLRGILIRESTRTGCSMVLQVLEGLLNAGCRIQGRLRQRGFDCRQPIL